MLENDEMIFFKFHNMYIFCLPIASSGGPIQVWPHIGLKRAMLGRESVVINLTLHCVSS